jgi:hypothetical protein
MTSMISSLSDIKNVVPVRETFADKLRKLNSRCLERAETFCRLAKKAYETFKKSKAKYLENIDPSDEKSLRSWFKKKIGIGRAARYTKMTSGIFDCLYETIFNFSNKIFEREKILDGQQCAFPTALARLNYIQELRKNSTLDQIPNSVMVAREIEAIEACWKNFDEAKLKELLDLSLPLQELSPNVSQEETRVNSSETDNSSETENSGLLSSTYVPSELQRLSMSQRLSEPSLSVSIAGGSRRYTHRRRHSKHSHKSIKRYKKGKKIMKSHKKKRHTHIRKQNKRKNITRN